MTEASYPYALRGSLALARGTVDRASVRRNDAAWLESVWKNETTRVLVVGDSTVPVRDQRLVFVAPDEAPDGERYFLGIEDGVEQPEVFVAVRVDMRPDDALTLREAGLVLGDRDAGLAVHAISLANWHAAHQYCPRCGAPTVVESAGHTRRCTVDSSEHYPRTDPAVIMLVVDEDDRCLLGRSALWPSRRFSTLAGFVDTGETPEHAVAREVLEEVGVVVEQSWYAGAQPWPFPSSLMLGYYARALGTEPKPDGEEVAEARWFSRADLVCAVRTGQIVLPSRISIARHLIRGWFRAELPNSR